jgi:radical SAM protein with 4Fe4S-binding SPASM domain
LDHCERHNLRLNLITNGTLITDRHIDRLRGRIFKVDLSIDSHSPVLYERIRVGGRFDRMLAGLRRLVALQQEESFQMTLIVVLIDQNLTTLAGTMAFAKRERVHRVRVQKMLPFFRDPHRFHPSEHFTPQEIRKYLDQAISAASKEQVSLELDLDPKESYPAKETPEPAITPPAVVDALFRGLMKERPGFCFQLASYVRIVPNGNVYPCCRGTDDNLKMGNLFEQSFDEIWNGPEYQKLRQEFLTGNLREGCRRCTLAGTGTL